MRIEADWLQSAPARAVTGLLEAGGHRALFVGGCVRNALLGAPVSDLDLSTDARPERVMTLAGEAGIKAIPTGIEHGTITLVWGKTPIEVTTFRKDVSTDGRRATVAFTDDISADAERRDFTMNALYCDGAGRLVDPLGGLGDLEARRVRFILDPRARVREDYLRILRFFRFHAWYGAEGLDAEGLAACAELAEGLEGIARERIGQEMLKLLAAPDPAPALAAMQQSGVLMRCLPGSDARALAPLVHLEDRLAPDPIRRLAALGGEGVPKALRLSKAAARQLDALKASAGSGMGAAELGYRGGFEPARDALLLRAAALCQPLDPAEIAAAAHGAAQEFPLRAADFAGRYQGAALGAALKEAETRWIAADFTLAEKSPPAPKKG